MTQQEFIEALRAKNKETGQRWEVRGDNAIRAVNQFEPGMGICPLAFVLGAKAGELVGYDAHAKLGLLESEVGRIMCSADGWVVVDTPTRRALLEACGLGTDAPVFPGFGEVRK